LSLPLEAARAVRFEAFARPARPIRSPPKAGLSLDSRNCGPLEASLHFHLLLASLLRLSLATGFRFRFGLGLALALVVVLLLLSLLLWGGQLVCVCMCA